MMPYIPSQSLPHPIPVASTITNPITKRTCPGHAEGASRARGRNGGTVGEEEVGVEGRDGRGGEGGGWRGVV